MENKPSKSLIVVLLLVILLVILGGATMLLISKNPEALKSTSLSDFLPLKKTQENPEASPTPVSTAPPITVDWKTYTNDKFGFSFKYPTSYSLKNLDQPINGIVITLANATTNKEIIIEMTSKFTPGDADYYKEKSPDSGFSFPNQPTWREFLKDKTAGPDSPRRAQTETNNKFFSVTIDEDINTRLTFFNSFTFTK